MEDTGIQYTAQYRTLGTLGRLTLMTQRFYVSLPKIFWMLQYYVFNRPSVAGAVLQTPSLLII